MKKLILPFILLLSAPVSYADVPVNISKTSTTTVAVVRDKSLGAKDVVTHAGQSAIAYLEDGTLSDAEARELLKFLDMNRVAQFTLGRYGRSLEPADFDRFMVAFETYASTQFKTHLAGFAGADLRIIETINRKPNDAVVKTEIKNAAGEVQYVNWRVLKNGDEWSVVDVEALGFWFAIEQRAQFVSTLDKTNGDIDALIKKLAPQS